MQFSENNLKKSVDMYNISYYNSQRNRFGDDGIEETLLPIPNRKVKLYSVNGTAWGTVWESRTLPGNEDL